MYQYSITLLAILIVSVCNVSNARGKSKEVVQVSERQFLTRERVFQI